jgi:serine/threonine protein kinase
MIGQTLGGRYELLARVGGGGMALVYKARDNLLNRFVAVKVLRPQFMHDEDFVKRFRREAQAAASLSHPNIVSIYDVGQEEDTHYIVMEYVDGPNLNEIIRERAPLQADEAVRIAGQIADALDHAHHNQIIHRDIKPHNILMGSNGRVKVTDFGIARAITSSTITQTGSVVGSVHYFSPEHAKGVSTGEKSDLYSLGIVLYQMLTARLPFLGESPISVALKHLQEPFEKPRKVNPHIPQSVENVIVRAMRKNPQERYQSAREMLADLETCLQPQRLNEPPVLFTSDDDAEADKTRVIPAIRPDMRNTMEAPAIKGSSSDEQWDSRGLEEKKRRWVMPTVMGIMAAVLIGVLLWAVFALKGQLSPSDVLVPSVVGPILKESSTEAEKGLVTKQSKTDIQVKEGSLITLTIGTGPDLPTMPGVTGKTFDEAKAALQDLGVKPDNIGQNPVNDDSEPGTVLDQIPQEGTQLDPSGTVTLKVSLGKATFPMPNLIDKKENEARAALEQNNLKLKDNKVIQEPSYSVPKGTVFKQFPAEQNEKVTAGTEVQLWVSSGYPPDAKEMTWNVTVSPAVDGQESTIKIMYSDARGDNLQWKTPRKIKSMTDFPVTLVLAPGKDGQIMVYRDGEFVSNTPVPYQDQPASASQTPASPPADGGNQGDQGGGQ